MNGYNEEQIKEQIKALLEERRQQEHIGNAEGVAACDASLRAFGYKAERPAKRAERRPAPQTSREKR